MRILGTATKPHTRPGAIDGHANDGAQANAEWAVQSNLFSHVFVVKGLLVFTGQPGSRGMPAGVVRLFGLALRYQARYRARPQNPAHGTGDYTASA